LDVNQEEFLLEKKRLRLLFLLLPRFIPVAATQDETEIAFGRKRPSELL